MHIEKAVKENTETLVECEVSSSNPASLMEFYIGGIKQKYSKQIQTPGSDNGINKTFVFVFTTDRSQNGKKARCRLQWNGTYIKNETEFILNITCE